ncbi:MAG: hypothetical protein PHF24_09745 [Syntrophomonas sp.]|nr:hypothetical protein [Syntrophomonas sp.]
MSILGKVFIGTVGLCADGLEYVITKSAHGIGGKYGKKEMAETASEIGSSAVRATESTVKTLADIVDGGIDAGVGYLADDGVKISKGLARSKAAGKYLVAGIGQGLAYTAKEGARTGSSALKAGQYYVKRDRNQASRELAKTKSYARRFGKVVLIGLLAVGPIKNTDKTEKGEAPEP